MELMRRKTINMIFYYNELFIYIFDIKSIFKLNFYF